MNDPVRVTVLGVVGGMNEWDEDFLDEMLRDVRDAVLEAAKSRRKRWTETVTLQSPRRTIEVTVTMERRS